MKVVQVIWSATALADLNVIFDFLTEKSPTAAARLIQTVIDRIDQVQSFPESGSIHIPDKDTGRIYRYLVEGYFKIIYSYSTPLRVIIIETIFDTLQSVGKIKLGGNEP